MSNIRSMPLSSMIELLIDGESRQACPNAHTINEREKLLNKCSHLYTYFGSVRAVLFFFIPWHMAIPMVLTPNFIHLF